MTNRTSSRFLRVTRAFGIGAVLSGILAIPSVASAQQAPTTVGNSSGWLRDRRYQEGAGIRAGNLELHPGIGGEIGYDSNWFLRSHREGAGIVNSAPEAPVRSGGTLRITPSFSVATLGMQRREQAEGGPQASSTVFRGGVSATYREFIGAEELRDQRNISGNAFARLDLNYNRPVGLGIFANYQRLIQPAVVADPNLSFNRSDLGAGAEVIVMPGGGTLDLRAGYQIQGALFEETNGVPFTSITHAVNVRNRWRFRPRTALFHDTGLSFVTYPHSERAVQYLNDSTPLRTRIGVTGLVTERFGTLLAIGYGTTFFRNPNEPSSQQFDSLLAQAEGTFYLSPGGGTDDPGQATLLLSTLSFGYLRDFQISLLGNFYEMNRGYARVVYNFGGRAVMQLDGYFEAQSYPAVFLNSEDGPVFSGVQPFTNYRAGGSLFAEYRFTDSFGLNTTIDYSQVISETQIPAGSVDAPGGLFDLNWRRFQAFVGARWFL
jgi:hypothetical protein